MSASVFRTTLFKVTNGSDIDGLIKGYDTMFKSSKKDGSPYILSCVAGRASEDARSQGYNLFSYLTFASRSDMAYYDTEDPAHVELKESAKGKLAGPPLTVFTETPVVVLEK